MRYLVLLVLFSLPLISQVEAKAKHKKQPTAHVENFFEWPKQQIQKAGKFIRGRLVCARNVNAELARRGIKGTGSRMAKSFLKWGRASRPVPGAVAVYSRGKRGGHVAIVSRVVGNKVYVLNPSSRKQRWVETIYNKRAIAYRVPLDHMAAF